ncbi:hypothetical protein PGT21_027444 [Puccinia graminis f. sp. tritici]|uniref:Uncharacterized protein n=1 Tax=Puccinia graminis f. sp. tritici TaxID=56615 RepID=A0A5B0S6C0_PUCGR|nr:hypothetical protein PGT21_027444 [Puccinia graminis f. sp. tritici]KAA1132965.1 hypothetical protein PGTUg99_013704 [Puccinia graminis f. sp. tritici]
MQINVFASLGLALGLLGSAAAELLFACDPIVALQPLGLCVSSDGIPIRAEKYRNSDRIFWPCHGQRREYCCPASEKLYVRLGASIDPETLANDCSRQVPHQ